MKLADYQIRRDKERAQEEREYGPIQLAAEKKDPAAKKGGEPAVAAAQQPNLPDLHQTMGYMPKRGDFDQEYDADADTLLADLEYFDDDTEQDIKLKNDVISLYNARIDERIRRKKFVLERGLLDFKKI